MPDQYGRPTLQDFGQIAGTFDKINEQTDQKKAMEYAGVVQKYGGHDKVPPEIASQYSSTARFKGDALALDQMSLESRMKTENIQQQVAQLQMDHAKDVEWAGKNIYSLVDSDPDKAEQNIYKFYSERVPDGGKVEMVKDDRGNDTDKIMHTDIKGNVSTIPRKSLDEGLKRLQIYLDPQGYMKTRQEFTEKIQWNNLQAASNATPTIDPKTGETGPLYAKGMIDPTTLKPVPTFFDPTDHHELTAEEIKANKRFIPPDVLKTSMEWQKEKLAILREKTTIEKEKAETERAKTGTMKEKLEIDQLKGGKASLDTISKALNIEKESDALAKERKEAPKKELDSMYTAVRNNFGVGVGLQVKDAKGNLMPAAPVDNITAKKVEEYLNNQGYSSDWVSSTSGTFSKEKNWELKNIKKLEGPVDWTLGNKPQIKNADGSVSTERTVTVGMGNKYYVIPTIINGEQVDAKEAVKQFRDGAHKAVGVFDDESEANTYAEDRSKRLGDKIYQENQSQKGSTPTKEKPSLGKITKINTPNIPGGTGPNNGIIPRKPGESMDQYLQRTGG
jgi:predicted dithiol-disulfide oxidoreductase (DUF899 family)